MRTFDTPVTLVAATLLLMMGCSAPLGSEPPTFRIVTYNIAAGREAPLKEIASVLEDLDADVIALQEVGSNWGGNTGFDDQAVVLGELLNMSVFFAPIYSALDERGKDREFGLAILSSLPIARAMNHTLLRQSTQTEGARPAPMPGFPEMVVRLNGEEVRIFNTHLDYRPDPAVRSAQVREMLEIMGDVNGPVLLVGDLNASPQSEELAPLFESFHDAWLGDEGSGYTIPASSPQNRIDYILVSDACEVRHTQVVEVSASDHLPIVAEVACAPSHAGS